MSLEHISGTATSVYTGCFSDDYKALLYKGTDNLPDYHATGVSMAMLANRVSWFFNVTGPSANFDSACSSSIMGLDAACRDLRDGTSKMVRTFDNLFTIATMLTVPGVSGGGKRDHLTRHDPVAF